MTLAAASPVPFRAGHATTTLNAVAGSAPAGYAASTGSFFTLDLSSGRTSLMGAFATPNATDSTIAQAPEPMSLASLAAAG